MYQESVPKDLLHYMIDFKRRINPAEGNGFFRKFEFNGGGLPLHSPPRAIWMTWVFRNEQI